MPEVTFTVRSISFDSEGVTCAGRLYLPDGPGERLPCVVMAHGFSGTMDWIVPDFAARFAAGGLAVLLFDYRYLGESGGKPRQLISTSRQRLDLQRAVEFARSLPEVDSNRIALWGTSLGGSHVVNMAAVDPSIAAVVANVPALDVWRGGNSGVEVSERGLSRWEVAFATLRLVAKALADAALGVLHLPPRYIRVYGPMADAVFSDPKLADLFSAIEAGSPTWRNRVTPRFLLNAPRYREGTMEHVSAPLLVTLARDDTEVSCAFVSEKASKAPRGEIKVYPVGHFDMYHGATFEQVVADQLAFLRRHLLGTDG